MIITITLSKCFKSNYNYLPPSNDKRENEMKLSTILRITIKKLYNFLYYVILLTIFRRRLNKVGVRDKL